MPRLLRAAVILTLALAFLLALPLVSYFAVSVYRRHQVSRLLATLRTFTPGQTTEAQARAALHPFSQDEYPYERNGDHRPADRIDFIFYNRAEWTNALRQRLTFLPNRIWLPWTLITISVSFQQRLLSELHITEMQEDIPGMLHPNAASVTIRSIRFAPPQRSPYGPTPTDFNGFSSQFQSTGQHDVNGKWTNFTCCYRRHILLDERATPAQHRDSLNFQLRCMTSYTKCKDDRAILP